MTAHLSQDPLTAELRAYQHDPMDDGDAVLLLDDDVCLEIAGLADHWDAQMLTGTAEMLRQAARRVVVAIARPGGDLRPADHRLWQELRTELSGSGLELLPVQALPAA